MAEAATLDGYEVRSGPSARLLERLAFLLPPTKAHWVEEILLGAAATSVALAIRALLDPLVHGDIVYIAFVPPVLLSAIIGGRLAGYFAAALGCLAANWFFVGRPFAFDLAAQHIWSLLISYVACSLLVLMGDRLAVGLRREAALNRRLELVSTELEHRIKNLIAVAQAVVNQTAKCGLDADQMRERINARLQAVGAAQSLIIRTPGRPLRLSELVGLVLQPFSRLSLPQLGEESVEIPSHNATSLALIINELATNASKYGALLTEEGHVDLSWREEDGEVIVTWLERGGPTVRPPARRGFGSALFDRALDPTEGHVCTSFGPEGLECQIRLRRRDTSH